VVLQLGGWARDQKFITGKKKLVTKLHTKPRMGRQCLKETGWEKVVWMHIAQDRDQWRALVNTVVNLRFP
jgi:hypothetical protein